MMHAHSAYFLLVLIVVISQTQALIRSSKISSISLKRSNVNGFKLSSPPPSPCSSSSIALPMNVASVVASISPRAVAAGPVMYLLMSLNEYITHRYYQHAEFNRNKMMTSFSKFVMNLEEAPKVKGGGHIEHHAETYDDMTLKKDERWLRTPAAQSLNADKYRGTAFDWTVMGLMVIQMLPTALPTFMLMGFSLIHTLAMVVPAVMLHGLVWNAIHPTMHGLDNVPTADGPPSWVLNKFQNTWFFKFLYNNHVGHHVVGGQGNYNVCCPAMDHILGTYVKESVWKPQVRPKPKFAMQ